ncbi:MAG: threonine/serine dehydratase [Chloroflexota bacterium]|jgi:threonine dehydratase|nr:threonine/serine dehydratase [Chloroflexota bacterium]
MELLTIAEVRSLRERLEGYVVETPVWQWRNRDAVEAFGAETAVFLKLELFQHTGTFKPRGALSVMLDLDRQALARGVTAVSAGNHAIAVAYAAQLLGAEAKVVMPKSASPIRVARVRSYGGEVVLVDDVGQAFAKAEEIQKEEGRTFVHPYEGPLTARGTATAGLEFCTQVPDLDAVIIPIGGGGLAAGMAAAVKALQPACKVYGVEPVGADTMFRSFQAGSPQAIERVRTFADSLGAPYALPYSFAMCRQFVDEIVLIDDDAMRHAMALLFHSMKLAVEPAGSAATAALAGPLLERLRGQRVGVIVCGTNIDIDSYARAVSAAEPVIA